MIRSSIRSRFNETSTARAAEAHSSTANFDRVARAYRWMEYCTFGPCLERCRFAQLDNLGHPKRALVLGDGDGRFLERLLRRYSLLTADVVDTSERMLRLLRQRVRGAGGRERVSLYQQDIRSFQGSATTQYDLIVCHFVLDCFSEDEIARMLTRLGPGLHKGTMVLVSEFAVPQTQPARTIAKLLVSALYCAFRLLTGLRVSRLPDYERVLQQAGFELGARTDFLGGILRSECWRMRI